MNDLITHICSIQNHPIQKLKESDQFTYLLGLGAFLSLATQKDEVRFLFNAWCYSILGYYKEDYGLFKADNSKYIQKSICVENKWWKFYAVRYTFFFDCFYLLCSRRYVNAEIVYSILCSYCKRNPFNKKDLKVFYDAFIHDSIQALKGLDMSLIAQWSKNNQQENSYKKILVVANVSAGKSMLINAITGHRICKSTNMACTNKLHYIYNKPQLDFSIYQTGMQFYILENADRISDYSYDSISLNFNSHLVRENICFIDTPGVNNSENRKHREITEQAIKNEDYDAMIYISNCQYFGTTDEDYLLKLIVKHTHKPVIYVLNQLDRFKSKEDSISRMVSDYRSTLQKLGVRNPSIIPLSAYAAWLMKQDSSILDEEDAEELEIYERRFSKSFYDLTDSVTQKVSVTLLDKTGITLLEETIQKIIAK
ncbi:dynamin family protein [Parabacteroides sp.]